MLRTRAGICFASIHANARRAPTATITMSKRDVAALRHALFMSCIFSTAFPSSACAKFALLMLRLPRREMYGSGGPRAYAFFRNFDLRKLFPRCLREGKKPALNEGGSSYFTGLVAESGRASGCLEDQSSGGNAPRQNEGRASENSRPISDLPARTGPRKTTWHSCSSCVRLFCSITLLPLVTRAFVSTSAP